MKPREGLRIKASNRSKQASEVLERAKPEI